MGNRQGSEAGRQTTLADVAARAGVSTATVSRCLNAPDRVVEDTRKRVLAAVSELGYSPNFGARALAARRTNTIGAIIPTMENAIFARGIQAFQEELHDHGYTLLVASFSYSMDLEEEQIRALVARGADGLLLIGQDRNPGIADFLRKRDVPALVTWSYDEHSAFPTVGFDNRLAMHDLARRAIAMGHRRLGMISAATARNDRARARLRGVRDALDEAGIDPKCLTLQETTYGIEQGAAAFARIIGADPTPSVVLCGNDVLAAGALTQARRMGLRVPDDVSITGFDDIELAQIAVPALTSVQVPHRAMGRTAARELVRMVRSQSPARSIKLAAEPIIRESLAPPSGRMG